MKTLLKNMIKAIVDKPDEVSIKVSENENTFRYKLRVNEGDIGKVIGKKGKNISSIEILLLSSSAKAGGKKAFLEIIE